MTPLTADSPEFFEFMRQSTSLRRARKFKEAITFVEEKLPSMSPECVVTATLEIFKAAWESGDHVTAKAVAERLYDLDPTLPSIKRYLDK